jgi:DNA helicase-2/ATP-dependent DNA helicase PcrA
VVGDDDQSIYRWRGANIRNILDFELDFPTARVVKLEQNYRSTQTILRGAHDVVKKIEERKPKELWTKNEAGDPIVYHTALTEKGEAVFVVQEIQRWIREEAGSYRDCAVFYRTNAQSRVLEDELRKNKIPYIIVGGIRFYDRREIRDILAYLYIIANPASSIHLKRVINVPARGIGKTSVERLEAFSLEKRMTLHEALAVSEEAGLSSKVAGEVKKFVGLLERLRTGLAQQKLSDWLRSVLEQTGYLAELKLENTLEAEDRIENLEELVSVVVDYETSTEEPSLGGFLDQITLASEVDKLSDEKGVLPLMTLHLAKGLEFSRVFITGLEEGLFPHTRSFETPEEMDEERRLMYVGMTRAKKKLYLTNASQRSVYGSEQYNIASRFLDDIPSEILDRRREKGFSFQGPAEDLPEATTVDENNPYRIGRRVRHPVFGVGTIKSCEGNVDDRKLTIMFPEAGLKRLVAKYSNLQLI